MECTTYGVDVERTDARLRHDMFVSRVRGRDVAFQIYHLHEQIYAYVGDVECAYAQSAFGVRVRGGLGGGGAATTTLIGTESGARASSDAARRLALKSGLSIVIGVNLPEGSEDLQGEVELELIRYLRESGAMEKDMRELERALHGM